MVVWKFILVVVIWGGWKRIAQEGSPKKDFCERCGKMVLIGVTYMLAQAKLDDDWNTKPDATQEIHVQIQVPSLIP
jgi:hypothetical protein